MYRLLNSANADMIASKDCKHVLCPNCLYCMECKMICKKIHNNWYVLSPKGTGEDVD